MNFGQNWPKPSKKGPGGGSLSIGAIGRDYALLRGLARALMGGKGQNMSFSKSQKQAVQKNGLF